MTTVPDCTALTASTCTSCFIEALSTSYLTFPYIVHPITVEVRPYIYELADGTNSTSYSTATGATPTTVQNATQVSTHLTGDATSVWTTNGLTLTSGTTYALLTNFYGFGPPPSTNCATAPTNSFIKLPATANNASLVVPVPSSGATIASKKESAILQYLGSLQTVVDQLGGYNPASCSPTVTARMSMPTACITRSMSTSVTCYDYLYGGEKCQITSMPVKRTVAVSLEKRASVPSSIPNTLTLGPTGSSKTPAFGILPQTLPPIVVPRSVIAASTPVATPSPSSSPSPSPVPSMSPSSPTALPDNLPESGTSASYSPDQSPPKSSATPPASGTSLSTAPVPVPTPSGPSPDPNSSDQTAPQPTPGPVLSRTASTAHGTDIPIAPQAISSSGVVTVVYTSGASEVTYTPPPYMPTSNGQTLTFTPSPTVPRSGGAEATSYVTPLVSISGGTAVTYTPAPIVSTSNGQAVTYTPPAVVSTTGGQPVTYYLSGSSSRSSGMGNYIMSGINPQQSGSSTGVQPYTGAAGPSTQTGLKNILGTVGAGLGLLLNL